MPKSKKVKVTHPSGGSVIYDSIKEAAEAYHLSEKGLYQAIHRAEGEPFKRVVGEMYKFQEVRGCDTSKK